MPWKSNALSNLYRQGFLDLHSFHLAQLRCKGTEKLTEVTTCLGRDVLWEDDTPYVTGDGVRCITTASLFSYVHRPDVDRKNRSLEPPLPTILFSEVSVTCSAAV